MAGHDTSPSNSVNPISQLRNELVARAASDGYAVDIRLDEFEGELVKQSPSVVIVPDSADFTRRDLSTNQPSQHLYAYELNLDLDLWAPNYETHFELIRWCVTALRSVSLSNCLPLRNLYNRSQRIARGRQSRLSIVLSTELLAYQPAPSSVVVTGVDGLTGD